MLARPYFLPGQIEIAQSQILPPHIGLEVLIVDDSPVKASEELWADAPW